MYFTILGDCTSSNIKIEKNDEEIRKLGIEEIKRLNKKYPKEGFPRFNFIYRRRVWNKQEECYLGWERKRGLLTELNSYLMSLREKENKRNVQNTFMENTILDYVKEHKGEVIFIKYIITLDADTNLNLGSGIQLIEAMAHPLNKPYIDKEKNVVIEGHGLIQPRVGIELEVSMQSKFTQIFAGDGGVDSYTNAISDVYQDNFGEGIFTGKGIYDLEVFYNVMKDKIPENTVLSHDLLEGCFLRCGLSSDIMVLDGYPSSYSSYMTRLMRWIRGDWQISKWIKSKELNKLSKYKILDNLRRSTVEIFSIVNLILLVILKMCTKVKITPFVIITIFSVVISSAIDIINYIVFRKENIKTQKKFTKRIDGLRASVYRGVISFLTLPTKAFLSFVAIIKTIYRMKFSKKHLLEWITAEEAEKLNKNDLKSSYRLMFANVIFGIIGITQCILDKSDVISNWVICILSVLWILTPIFIWNVSKQIDDKKSREKLNKDELDYVKQIALNTWKYFDEYMNKENNFLPPDNFQESRREKVVSRTSSTNIGLACLTIVSAYDLKFINLEKAINDLEKIIDTIQKLDKWNGHLYNWYNTKTLKPLIPRYVSTVDSGNFVRIYVYFKSVFRGKSKYQV